MRKLLIAASILIISCTAAHADKLPIYLSLGTGYVATNDSDWSSGGSSGAIGIDDTESFSAAVGASFLKNTRAELEASYRNADLNKISLNGTGSAAVTGSVETWAFLVNGYYDFLEGQKFRPYVSAGAGFATHQGKITAVGGLGTPGANGSDTVFAYQAGLGGTYSLTERTDLWIGYRYLGSSDTNLQGVKASYGANEVNTGLRFNF